MKPLPEKPLPRNDSFGAVVTGIVAGLIALGFAVGLCFAEMYWLAFGAGCYAVMMIWLSYECGCAIQDGDIHEDEEEAQ